MAANTTKEPVEADGYMSRFAKTVRGTLNLRDTFNLPGGPAAVDDEVVAGYVAGGVRCKEDSGAFEF